jgi:hypothetical protein
MSRKIYYKKKFYNGLFALLLGLANPVTCLFRGWDRFDWKDGILCALLVLTGLGWILRSLDREKAREDRDEDRDERSRWIDLRSQALCYRVGSWLVVLGIVGCSVGYGVTGEMAWVHMALPLLGIYLTALAVRLAGWFHYENRG